MWVKQCHKPPMTGNGKHTTYKNGDDWGMVYGIVLPIYLSIRHFLVGDLIGWVPACATWVCHLKIVLFVPGPRWGTMDETWPVETTVDGCASSQMVYPIIYRVSTIQGGAGFLPSVWPNQLFFGVKTAHPIAWLPAGPQHIQICLRVSVHGIPPPNLPNTNIYCNFGRIIPDLSRLSMCIRIAMSGYNNPKCSR